MEAQNLLSITDWRHPYTIAGQEVPLAKPWYRHWHPWRWSVHKALLDHALDGNLQGKSLLDVGCQDGWYSFEAAKAGASVVGIDLRDEAIQRANLLRQYFRLENPQFMVGNVEEAETVHGQFDAVLNFGLLYHLADPIGVVRRLGAATRRVMAVQTFIHSMDRAPVLHLLREGVGLPGKGATELITTPTQRAIVLMLQEAGFDHVYRLLPRDYVRFVAPTGSNGEWQWSFFVGLKGQPLPPLPDVHRIDENSAPLNCFGLFSQAVGLAKARARRWRGRDTVGGF
jgi:SAM-dependent methyltransferase